MLYMSRADESDDMQLVPVLRTCFHITTGANLVFFGVTSLTDVACSAEALKG